MRGPLNGPARALAGDAAGGAARIGAWRALTGLTALLCLAALAGCSEPRTDWRIEVGQPTGNPVLVRPAPPLAVPPDLSLPPPSGRADPDPDA